MGITLTSGDNSRFYMLLGEYTHSVDTKGRMAIPAKFRSRVQAGAIVTRGLDRCLFVFSVEEWEKMVQKIIALPLAQAGSRAFSRLMLAGATDVELDAQGRVLIPETLRAYAGLKKDAVVTGLFNRIEIWDKETWNTYKTKTESAADEIAEKLGALGI